MYFTSFVIFLLVSPDQLFNIFLNNVYNFPGDEPKTILARNISTCSEYIWHTHTNYILM